MADDFYHRLAKRFIDEYGYDEDTLKDLNDEDLEKITDEINSNVDYFIDSIRGTLDNY
jgi:hypothetical protein